MPKLSFPCALPVGTESLCETADVELYAHVSSNILKEKLNIELPDGIEISDVKDITGNGKNAVIKESHYHIDMTGLEINRQNMDSFFNMNYFGVVKKTKKGEKEVNAREMVKSIRFSSDTNIELEILHSEGPELRPARIIAEIFKVDPDNMEEIRVLKIRQITD